MGDLSAVIGKTVRVRVTGAFDDKPGDSRLDAGCEPAAVGSVEAGPKPVHGEKRRAVHAQGDEIVDGIFAGRAVEVELERDVARGGPLDVRGHFLRRAIDGKGDMLPANDGGGQSQGIRRGLAPRHPEPTVLLPEAGGALFIVVARDGKIDGDRAGVGRSEAQQQARGAVRYQTDGRHPAASEFRFVRRDLLVGQQPIAECRLRRGGINDLGLNDAGIVSRGPEQKGTRLAGQNPPAGDLALIVDGSRAAQRPAAAGGDEVLQQFYLRRIFHWCRIGRPKQGHAAGLAKADHGAVLVNIQRPSAGRADG